MKWSKQAKTLVEVIGWITLASLLLYHFQDDLLPVLRDTIIEIKKAVRAIWNA